MINDDVAVFLRLSKVRKCSQAPSLTKEKVTLGVAFRCQIGSCMEVVKYNIPLPKGKIGLYGEFILHKDILLILV